MHQEQRQQTQALLKSKSINYALFTNFYSVKWLTGFNPPVQTGPAFFAGGPPLVWYEDEQFTLVAVDTFADQAEPFGRETDGRVITYPGYTIEQPLAGTDHLVNVLRQLSGGKNGRSLAVETADLPLPLAQVLPTTFIPIDGWLKPLRMIKTAEELTKLRDNFALTDYGHAVARQVVAVGQREIDVWATIHTAIQQQAGQRVPLGNDCVVGYREGNNMGGWPLNHVLRPGDSMIVDLSTQLHGYWSDSCATYYATEPSPRQIAIYQTVANALELAISLVRPGAVARDIDQKVRAFIASAGYPVYPHHTGHSVGVFGHEDPRLVPYNDQVLAEGMVMMLEPGIYFPGETGVRLEDAVLVTADGAEILTRHNKSL